MTTEVERAIRQALEELETRNQTARDKAAQVLNTPPTKTDDLLYKLADVQARITPNNNETEEN